MNEKKVKLVIDGVETEAAEGMTIMQAADAIGIRIPRLCYHPHLSLAGAHTSQAEDIAGDWMAQLHVSITQAQFVDGARGEIVSLADHHVAGLVDEIPG